MPQSLQGIGFLLIVLLLAAVKDVRADPRPDFAIKATISGTGQVVSLSNQISASFDKVDSLNIPLTGGYHMLENMKAALLYIGSHIASAGMAISTSINSLAGNSSNNVNPIFQSVYDAINALRTLLQTGLTAQLASLEQQAHFITDQFADGFSSILAKLATLSSALDQLKAGVTAARDAPGNTATAVSAVNLGKYVTPKMIKDVQEALSALNGAIPLIQYIVESTQKRLSTADAFLGEMASEAQINIDEVSYILEFFDEDATTIGDTVAGSIDDLVTPVYAAQIGILGEVQSVIELIPSYPDDLQPALSSLALLLDTGAISAVSTSIQHIFTEYISAVASSAAGAFTVETFFAEESCGALVDLIDSLVASGSYASYCFAKFSPQLFNQFALTFYTISECYDIETVRLSSLQDLVLLVVEMIVYDIEDLGEAIISCTPLTDQAACITTIGPFYDLLAITIDEKQAYMLNYIEEETTISLQRLNSCVTVTKYGMVTAVEAISVDLDTCTVSGPAA